MALAPKLMVRDLQISTTYAQPRQEIQINARVVNDGGMWGSKTLHLMINGQFEQSRGVGVAPGTAKPISFTVYKVDAGEYQVDIGGATGTFYVVEEAQAPGAAQPTTEELGTGTLIIIIVIGFILIAGIIVAIVVSSRP